MLGTVLAVLVCIPTVVAFAGGTAWFLELTTPFRAQFVIIALFALALTVREPGGARFVAAGAALVNLACLAPQYLAASPRAAPAPDAQPLSILSFNVHATNRAFAEVRAAIRHHAPDVLILFEVNDGWMRELSPLEGYTLVAARPRPDNFGIATWARVPVTRHRFHIFSRATVPSIELVVPRGRREIVVLGTHTLPPVSAYTTERRDEHLLNLARWVKTSTRATVIVGDLNVTPFSAVFDEMLELGGLHRATNERTATWPAHAPWLTAILGIPIDHALLGPQLGTTRFEVGENYGSDHRALLVKVVDRDRPLPTTENQEARSTSD